MFSSFDDPVARKRFAVWRTPLQPAFPLQLCLDLGEVPFSGPK
jgi:hypothetical protein